MTFCKIWNLHGPLLNAGRAKPRIWTKFITETDSRLLFSARVLKVASYSFALPTSLPLLTRHPVHASRGSQSWSNSRVSTLPVIKIFSYSLFLNSFHNFLRNICNRRIFKIINTPFFTQIREFFLALFAIVLFFW